MTPTKDYSQMQNRSFRCMGTRVGLWVDRDSGRAGSLALRTGEAFLRGFDRQLSRFKADSELTRLNADRSDSIVVSPLMGRFIETALWAAQASNGLVDPTVVDALERNGYTASREGAEPASLTAALAAHPKFSPAGHDPAELWRRIQFDADALTVTRPAGLRIDSGGSGKGLAADMLATMWRQMLPIGTDFVIDCGGDLHVSDTGTAFEIAVDHPLSDGRPQALVLSGGAVATSGIGNRIWSSDGGAFAHHLIDPATNAPAWTGLVSVSAVGTTTVVAETIAKTALLGGPQMARDLLDGRGGMSVHASGEVEYFETAEGGLWSVNETTSADAESSTLKEAA